MLKEIQGALVLGVTWLKWLPTVMESWTMLTSKSNKVNTQKLESKPRVQTQMYDDSIGTTTYCMIICMKSRLTSFSYDSVTEGCISVKCQLLTVNFVWSGCQPGFRLHTSRQSFEPSYTQIQALLVFLWAYVAKLYPRRIGWTSLGGC